MTMLHDEQKLFISFFENILEILVNCELRTITLFLYCARQHCLIAVIRTYAISLLIQACYLFLKWPSLPSCYINDVFKYANIVGTCASNVKLGPYVDAWYTEYSGTKLVIIDEIFTDNLSWIEHLNWRRDIWLHAKHGWTAMTYMYIRWRSTPWFTRTHNFSAELNIWIEDVEQRWPTCVSVGRQRPGRWSTKTHYN